MTVRWTLHAHRDYANAISYVAEQNRRAARRLVMRIRRALADLDARRVEGPEFALVTGETVRGWFCAPYRIYYTRTGTELVVVRLYDQRREPIVSTPPREGGAAP